MAYVKDSGEYSFARPYVKEGGIYKPSLIYVKSDGSYSASAKAMLAELVEYLGGSLYLPNVSNFENSNGTTAASANSVVGYVDDLVGDDNATQATTANKPFLRSKDYSRAQWVSGQRGSTGFDFGAEALVGMWATQAGYDNTTTSVSASSFTQTGATTTSRSYQNFTTVAGKPYQLSVKVGSVSSGTLSMYVRDTDPTGTILSTTTPMVAGTTYTISFFALSTTTSILIVSGAAGASSAVSGATVKELLAGTGETWSITNTAVADNAAIKWDAGEVYLRCPGIVGNYASTPDSAAISFSSGMSIIAKASLDDWTPSAGNCIVSQYNSSLSKRRFELIILSDGRPSLITSADGTETVTHSSSASVDAANGSAKWIKATLDLDNGSNSVCTFYTSADGVTYTQLGTTVTGTQIAGLYDTNQPLEIGSRNAGASDTLAGKIYYAAIYNNATATGTPAVEFYPARDCIHPSSAAWDFDNSNDYLQTPINPTSSGYICVAARQDEALGGANTLVGAGRNSVTYQPGIDLAVNTTGVISVLKFGTDATVVTASTSSQITVGSNFVADCDWTTANQNVRLNGDGAGTSSAAKDPANTGTVLTFGVRNRGTNISFDPTEPFGGAIFGVVHIPGQTTGAELVTNGGFDTNLTGWTVTLGGQTVESSGGKLHIVTDGTGCGVYQGILTNGDTYEISLDYTATSGTLKIDAGNTYVLSTTGRHVFRIVASGSRLYVYRNSGAAEGYVDNLSVKKYIQPVSATDQATIRKLMGQIAGVSGVV